MSYKVRIESFEGPFDLLLYLVSRQKVDIGAVSVTEIADQYLAEVSRMESLDLEVASDFLLVAATLLEIKAASLVPAEKPAAIEALTDLAPSEARTILIERLLAYKQYKNAAGALHARFLSEGRMHPRPFGPDAGFLGLVPDYLEGITLDGLAQMAAGAFARRDIFLLEAAHIAAKPIPVEQYMETLSRRISSAEQLMFSDLIGQDTPVAIVVVTFLAILELYKRSMVEIGQDEAFGDICIRAIEGRAALPAGDAGAPMPQEEG